MIKKIKIFLVLFCVLLVYGNCCKFLINELNAHTIKSPKSKFAEFIEIIAVNCAEQELSLHNYVLLIVTEREKKSNRPAVLFTADLQKKRFHHMSGRNQHLFIVGEDKLDNVDLKFSDNMVSWLPTLVPTQSIARFFRASGPAIDDARQYSNAVLLLQTDKEGDGKKILDSMKYKYYDSSKNLKERKEVIVLEPETIKIISDHLIDILIYSKRLEYEHSQFFHDILPEKLRRNVNHYELRPGFEWDSPDADRSLSRCPINNVFKAFDFFSYKLAPSTPRMPNACGEAFAYILTDRAPDMENAEEPMDTHLHLEDLDSNDNGAPQQKRQRLLEAIEQDVQEIDELTPSSSSLTTEERRITDFYQILVKEFQNTCESYKSQISTLTQQRQDSSTCSAEEQKEAFPWLDSSHWTQAHKDLFKKAFGITLKLSEIQKGWVKIIPTDDETNPNFGCKVCQEHYELNKERYRNDPKNLNDFAQPSGASYLASSTQNKPTFWRKKFWAHEHPYAHSKTDMGSHPRIIMQLVNIYTKKKSSDIIQAEQTLTLEKRNTLKMFRTVYMLVKRNIAFQLFPDLVKLQQQNGALPDKIMHANRRSLGRMITTTATSLKNSYIATIIAAKPPISIIVDSSTDKQSRQYLLIYLQFTYNLKQQCVLYRVVLLESETAQSMLEVIMKCFKEDKIDSVIQDHLVAFVADGASVMQGNKGGLGTLLEEWANWAAVETPAQQLRKRDIQKIHCSAHRLQLAVSHVVTKEEPIKTLQVDFQATINGIHSFYNRNSPKRRSSLYNYAETWKVNIHQLKAIFKVRWLSSQYAAINSLHRNYFLILYHLLQVKESNDFDTNTKQMAAGYYRKMCTVDFYLYLIFQMDILKPLSEFSEILQTDFYTLPYLHDDLENTVTQVKELETTNGFHVHHFLFLSECKKQNEIMPCTVELVENEEVEVSIAMDAFFPKSLPEAKFTFKRRNTHKFKLSNFRTLVVPKLVQSLNEYFPINKELLEKLAYLNPKKLPTGTDGVSTYSFQLVSVFKTFGAPAFQTTNEMMDLLKYLLQSDKINYFKMREETMVKFWTYAIQTAKTQVQIGAVETLIEKIFAIPPGSVVVERGFSIFFYSKNPRRSRLAPSTLQNIMTILVNGPAPEAFDPHPATNLWIQKHRLSDDVAPPNDPNTDLLPATLLPPERFIQDETTEIFEFDDEKEEAISALDDITFPEASTFADDAEEIEFIYPPFDV